MSRFKVELALSQGRAKTVVKDRGEVVGMMNISVNSHEALLREIVQTTLDVARKSISENLGAMIWHDAQSVCDGDAELAKKRLAALGWTQEKTDAFADNLARNLAQVFASMMPEIV